MKSQKSGPLSAPTNSLWRRRGVSSGGVSGNITGARIGRALWAGPVDRESRLELAGLLFADFEPSVRHIVAQPFFLRATVDLKVCKHVPDHLLATDEALSIWTSSLSVAMVDPKEALRSSGAREVVEARGWRYEVATEPSAVELGNVRFLSARGGAQKLVIRSPDPNDIGIHTGCRSCEVSTDHNTEETKWGSVR